VDDDLHSSLWWMANLALDRTEGGVQPPITVVVTDVGHAAHQSARPALERQPVPLPREEDGRAIIGYQRAADVAKERAVRANVRKVPSPPRPLDPPPAPPLGEQDLRALGARRAGHCRAPALGGAESGPVERVEPHRDGISLRRARPRW